MEPVWTRSQWSFDDLENKTVEFRLRLDADKTVSGRGRFLLAENPDLLLSVRIRVDMQGDHWSSRIQHDYQAPQAAVDRIERHPDPTVADFRLIE
jgi:hypothetical protein